MSDAPLTLRDLDGLGLERIKGVGDKKKAALEDFGIHSVLDLLETYPRRYIDRSNLATIRGDEQGVDVVLMVRVVSVRSFRTRNGRAMVTATVDDVALPWRKGDARRLQNVLLMTPSPHYLAALPFGKLPDRNDFKRFMGDAAGRKRYWYKAIAESQRLGDELLELGEGLS